MLAFINFSFIPIYVYQVSSSVIYPTHMHLACGKFSTCSGSSW